LSWVSALDARGRFTQSWAVTGGVSRGLRDLLRWQLRRAWYGIEPDPELAAFDVATPDVARPHAAPDELRITWIGHATFLVQVAGLNILTDPVWSRRASPVQWAGPARVVPAALPFDELPGVDVVMLSHDHYDHLDSPTVRRLCRRFADLMWITPLGYASWLRRHGATSVIELDWWQSAHIAAPGRPALEVTAAPVQHWTKRMPWDERRRLWASFCIDADAAGRVYFAGDSGYFDGFRAVGAELGPFDVVMLPIGAYAPRWFMHTAHMDPDEAVRAFDDLGASGIFVPMHWGTFRLADDPVFEPAQWLRRTWHDQKRDVARLWIPQHGESRVLVRR
jgi:N-acyl-phosphatidylethanolamine-hydrolysing phospholipase D